MNRNKEAPSNSRTLRFHEYGKPEEVLRLERTKIATPQAAHIRVRVKACGLNPVDWGLCQGLFAGLLPRGVGLDVAGIVESVGAEVKGVAVGDSVLGRVDFLNYTSAGAADYAVLDAWAHLPAGMNFFQGASLPMAVETAFRSLDNLRVTGEHKLLVHGAGTVIGFAAVQMALMRGARVIATAGPTFADRLLAFGAVVTRYGDGIVERVLQVGNGAPDLVLDAAPPSGVLPDLVKIAGDPKRVLTITDFATAKELGVRESMSEDLTYRFDVLAEYAQLAAEGKFEVPIARTYALDEWRDALQLSQSNAARGKVILSLDEPGD